MVSLDLNIGGSLPEVSVDVATLGKRAFRRAARSSRFSVVRLGSSVSLKLRAELRGRRDRGSLGCCRRLELSDLALVCVGGLQYRQSKKEKEKGRLA